MSRPELLKTQSPPRQPRPPKPGRRRAARAGKAALWLLGAAFFLLLATAAGGLAGYRTGERTRLALQAGQASSDIQEQFRLGVQDQAEGRYEIAYQRYEWVLGQDPAFPGVADRIAEVMAILYATATPTPPAPTITPTPTRDLRPVQDLLAQAQAMVQAQDWSGAIDTLVALRQADAKFHTAEVDGMLYLALRARGVKKILEEGTLEGGIYDLTLAEGFGPLDGEAEGARSLARVFITGNSFWEAYPAQAVYYFQQVAAAAPYLRDASGWTASARYRGALIQLGDAQMAQENWCDALNNYTLALNMGSDAGLEAKVVEATELCYPPTPTPTETGTPTWTPTATTFIWTPSPTVEWIPTDTPPVIVPATETFTPEVTVPPAPSETPTPTPSATPEPPTQEPATQAPVEISPTP